MSEQITYDNLDKWLTTQYERDTYKRYITVEANDDVLYLFAQVATLRAQLAACQEQKEKLREALEHIKNTAGVTLHPPLVSPPPTDLNDRARKILEHYAETGETELPNHKENCQWWYRLPCNCELQETSSTNTSQE